MSFPLSNIILINFDHSYCINYYFYCSDQIPDEQLKEEGLFSHIVLLLLFSLTA